MVDETFHVGPEPDHPHEVTCNASRRVRIGGDACSCRAGQEIKKLREHIKIHAGDTISLSGEVDMWRERALEAEQALADSRNQLVKRTKALEEISGMDPWGCRADDLGRAARTARTALTDEQGTSK
jgi:hypothetical protein